MEWLPALLALVCPLMMIFMMIGGHGHGHGHKRRNEKHGGNEINDKLMNLELENRSLREELEELKSVVKKDI